MLNQFYRCKKCIHFHSKQEALDILKNRFTFSNKYNTNQILFEIIQLIKYNYNQNYF